jgi:hypothetical protein
LWKTPKLSATASDLVVETLLNLCGLLFTAGGAFVTAWAVIISDEQANLLSGTYWNGNEALRKAFLDQSRNAGLICVGFGTLLQIAAICAHVVGAP